MNFQFQFTVSRFAIQIQTSPCRKFFSQYVLSRQRLSLDKFSEQTDLLTSPTSPTHPTNSFFQLRRIHCTAVFLFLSFLTPSLSASFNQQLCFDFHLRLFVARCTFGSFQWHSSVPTHAQPTPRSRVVNGTLSHTLTGFFAYFAPFAGSHCRNS